MKHSLKVLLAFIFSIIFNQTIFSQECDFGNIYINAPEEACPEEKIDLYANYNTENSFQWTITSPDGTSETYTTRNIYDFQSDQPGKHPIEQTISNDNCARDTTLYDTLTIKTDLPFDKSISYNISSDQICPGEPVDIYTYTEAKSYAWDFGNGETSSEKKNYDYQYTKSGEYPITLTLNNGCGNDSTVYDTIHVNDNRPFKNNISYNISDKKACPGDEINFRAYTNAKKYLWKLSSTSQSTEKYVYDKQYTSAGTYPIELTLTNYCDNDTTIFDTVEILNNLPVQQAYLNIYDKISCPGKETSFNASEASSFQWDFGDGTIKNTHKRYQEHTYYTAGSYPVSLKLTNNCQMDTMLYDTVHIKDNLPVKNNLSYNISAKELCPGEAFRVSSYDEFKSYYWTFGDGSSSNEKYTTHQYTAAGDYPVSFKVVNYCDKDTTLHDTIEVNTSRSFDPTLKLSLNNTKLCPGQETSMNSPYSSNMKFKDYHWDFGNGKVSDQKWARTTYNDTGTYQIALTLTNYCDQDTTLYDSVVVKDNWPVNGYISVNISQNQACPSDQISFYAYNQSATDYIWDFGDGNQSTQRNTDHTYNNAGTYKVSVTMTNACGRDTTISDSITIKNNLPYTGNLNWQFYPGQICPGESIDFQTSERARSYEWDFGDSLTSIQKDPPKHKYSEAGVYNVSLRLTNGCGNDTTLYDSIEVIEDLEYKGSVGYGTNVSEICPDEAIHFNAWENARSYLWNLGDGNISREKNFKHSFKEAGLYTYSLTLINGCGNDTTVTDSLTIKENSPINPSAQIQVWPGSQACPNEDITFSLKNVNATNIRWNFGDGETSTQKTATHSYSIAANYNVSVQITNNCGNDTIIYKDITIKNDIKPNLSAYEYNVVSDKACPGDSVIFSIMPINSEYTWHFGDGHSSSNPELFVQANGDGATSQGDNNTIQAYLFKHAYENEGDYQTYIEITNGCGNTVTDSINIEISSSTDINPYFHWNTNSPSVDSTIAFFAHGANQYIWDFGDGSPKDTTYNTYSQNTHVYQEAGEYQIQVDASNSCGFTKSKAYNISIYDINEGINAINTGYCPGDTVWFDGQGYSQTGVYYLPVNTDSAILLTINEFPTYNKIVDTSFCQGSAIIIDDTFYSTPGQTVTDTLESIYGCDSIVTYNLKYDTAAYNEELCMVRVDLETGKNMLVWEKTPNMKTSMYYLYRESNTQGDYFLLDSVPYDTLSVYVDETSNPESQQHLYKIQTKDRCGNITSLDQNSYHKTMLLQYSGSTGGINLSWNNRYEIDGSPYSFQSYIIYRGSDSTALQPIDTVSGSIYAYIDTSTTALNQRMYYRIGGVKSAICDPAGLLKASSGPFSQSISNLEDNRLRSSNNIHKLSSQATHFTVFPNPYKERSWIQYQINKKQYVRINIYNMMGEKIETIFEGYKPAGIHKKIIGTSSLSQGMYFIELILEGKKYTRRLIKIE